MLRTRERGSALLVVVVVIFVIVALTAAYVGQSVSVARGTSSSEARLDARTTAEGTLVTDEGDPPFYAAYRIRAYGTARGEVAGLEALVLRQTTRPFQFAAFGDSAVVGNGSIYTDSWNSNTTARYADATVKGSQGN